MRTGLLSLFAWLTLFTSCAKETPQASPPTAAPSASPGPKPLATASSAIVQLAPSSQLMGDKELGVLVGKVSEPTGEFPSDNFVSNETSYLDVVGAFSQNSLEGRTYLGVGPEQNLTYISRMKPSIAYIVDIRRQNMLELMVIRTCIESETTRTGFLSCLTSRPAPSAQELPESAPIQQIVDKIATLPASKARLEEGTKASLELLARLGMKASRADEASIAEVRQAFFAKGLSICYSMKGSARAYPSLGALLTTKSPVDNREGFLASEGEYGWLRQFIRDNRLVPVVGDFGSPLALGRVGDDMKARGLKLGVFYTSNVEQYLFEDHKYEVFLSNIRRMPIDNQTLMLRVWFDQGRAHPKQRKGHRTTSLMQDATGFLDRAEKKPFRSYWEVMQYPSLEPK